MSDTVLVQCPEGAATRKVDRETGAVLSNETVAHKNKLGSLEEAARENTRRKERAEDLFAATVEREKNKSSILDKTFEALERAKADPRSRRIFGRLDPTDSRCSRGTRSSRKGPTESGARKIQTAPDRPLVVVRAASSRTPRRRQARPRGGRSSGGSAASAPPSLPPRPGAAWRPRGALSTSSLPGLMPSVTSGSFTPVGGRWSRLGARRVDRGRHGSHDPRGGLRAGTRNRALRFRFLGHVGA